MAVVPERHEPASRSSLDAADATQILLDAVRSGGHCRSRSEALERTGLGGSNARAG
ncbi:MAG TPA: hypothetical protein VHK06_01060 [Candidatus Limnocylindria bacterium]|nr:hypothetical protein [Candidatus Limnocylindria bacterium]